MNDLELVNGLKELNEQSFNLFVEKYSSLMIKVLSCLLNEGHEKNYIEDAYNESLTCIWKNINSFSEKSSFKTWIVAITKYRGLDFKRRLKNNNDSLQIDENILPTEDNVENSYLKSTTKDTLLKILSPLKEIDKDIFLLYYWHRYDANNIASILHVSEANVFKRLSRGRKKLKDYYGSKESISNII